MTIKSYTQLSYVAKYPDDLELSVADSTAEEQWWQWRGNDIHSDIWHPQDKVRGIVLRIRGYTQCRQNLEAVQVC